MHSLLPNEDGDAIECGREVLVYYNIRRKCLSVMDARTRRVVAHRNSMSLVDATFIVNEAGRRRVLKSKRKNVHAFVRGRVVSAGEFLSYTYDRGERLDEVRYNPYKAAYFIRAATGRPIKESAYVSIDGSHVNASRKKSCEVTFLNPVRDLIAAAAKRSA